MLKAAVLRTAGPSLYNSLRANVHGGDGAAIGMRALPPEGTSATKIIDTYGQYTGTDWPEKIRTDADFAARTKSEDEDLDAHPGPVDRDEYGGWPKGPQLTATGYFRTQDVGGKWWLVTPSGHLFFSIGVANPTDKDPTFVSGREKLFSSLPSKDGILSSHYATMRAFSNAVNGSGETFDFYGANLERKYGADYERKWRANVYRRLNSWGFNTLGNWADIPLWHADRIPYTADMNIAGDFHKVDSGENHWGRIADPFDPEFAKAAKVRLKMVADRVHDDPWCLGYFIDNELSWRSYNNRNGRYGLSLGALADDAAYAPEKAAFVDQLKARYLSIDKLNAAWSSHFESWNEFAEPVHIEGDLTDAEKSDFSRFIELFAGQYFKVVSETLKQLDPNHLYLGCRIAVLPTEQPLQEVFRAAAKYCDVISFNYYNRDLPQNQFAFFDQLSKPLLIGEFHFGATDRGTFWGGMCDAGSQEGRAAAYRRFVESAVTNPSIVGCHWYRYVDQPVTGATWSGENAGIGLVDITDTPYMELINAARDENDRIYATRSK
jgi:hypothetical protein